ncbi:MAG: hypothetical protein HUU35_08095 [Armatimonadetes bacterium]|nr:hypothetical protein [Armatimonadota bacterium]
MAYEIRYHPHFARWSKRLRKDKELVRLTCRTIGQLRQGQWANARVKQLHGSLSAASRLLEAFVRGDERLLFAKTGDHELLVWSLARHDELRSEQRLSARYTMYDDVRSLDVSALLDELRAPADSDPLVDPATAPVANPVDLDFMCHGARACYHLPDDGQVQADNLLHYLDRIEEHPEEMQAYLLLTEEQSQIVRMPQPVLLDGCAGSGKSTVVVRWLDWQIRHCAYQRALFVSWMNGLVERSRQLFNSIEEAKPAGTRVDFLTYEALARTVLERAGAGLEVSRRVDWAWFAGATIRPRAGLSWWARRRTSHVKDLEPLAVWSEIQGTIKGRGHSAAPLLSLESYLALPQRNLPRQAERIWELACRYQEEIEKDGRWDEQDRARRAQLLILDGVVQPDVYDALALDEVQDLSQRQLSVAMACRAPQGALLAAGDRHQIIHCSAFAWDYVSEDLGQASPGQVAKRSLGASLRSSVAITRFAERIRGKHQELLAWVADCPPAAPAGASDEHRAKTTNVRTRAAVDPLGPRRISGREEEVLEAIRALVAQAGQNASLTVLTRSEEARQRVLDRLGPGVPRDLVVSITMFKGLESEAVLVWRFFDDPYWRQHLDRRDEFVARWECNRFYVAITRGRMRLLLYDRLDDPTPWEAQEFGSLLGDSVPADFLLSLNLRPRSADECRVHADNYASQGYDQLAADCYQRAAAAYERDGEATEAARCRLRSHELRGEWNEAGREALGIDLIELALKHFEAADNAPMVAACRAEQAELAEHWRRARQYWEQAERWDRAGYAAERSQQWYRAAKLFARHGDAEALAGHRLRHLQRQLRLLGDELQHELSA